MQEKYLIIANWKMNPTKGSEAKKMFETINAVGADLEHVETVVCPPLIYLESLGESVTSRSCVLGAQDAFWEHEGAYTGQVSPDMIFNAKARYVIVGHSEKRAMGETDEMVNKKIKSILQFPLIPVVCIGEKNRDADSNYVKELKMQTEKSLAGLSHEELSRVVLVYEPVWAISTNHGGVCTPAECAEAIQVIRQMLADIFGDVAKAQAVTIIYGGSVNETDVQGFLTDGLAAGAIVGHASLDPKEFIKILKVAEKVANK